MDQALYKMHSLVALQMIQMQKHNPGKAGNGKDDQIYRFEVDKEVD